MGWEWDTEKKKKANKRSYLEIPGPEKEGGKKEK